MQTDDPLFGALSWDDEERAWRGAIDFGGRRVELSIGPGLTDPTPEQRQGAIDQARTQIGPLLSSEPRLLGAALAALAKEEDAEDWLGDGRLPSALRLVEIALHGSGELYYDCSLLLGTGTLLTVFFGPGLEFGDAEMDVLEPAFVGAFRARQFRVLSFEPDLVFQFFVAPDRLCVVKVGPALDRLTQAASARERAGGAPGPPAGGVPAPRQVSALVRSDPANYVLKLDQLARARLVTRSWFGAHGSLTLHLKTGRRLSYRFLDGRQLERARVSLRAALRDRLED